VTSQLQQHVASSQRFKDVRCCTLERQAFPKEHSTFLLGLDASEDRSAKTHVPQVRTAEAADVLIVMPLRKGNSFLLIASQLQAA